ncbi:MAG TPA: MFS transporter [Roseiflexaceae bacterium]|nr:MFS transporter [Roseiflexaceae bacterium]
MSANAAAPSPPAHTLSHDFWKFWVSQTISNLGSSFTSFALPLLIFQLTGSALNLAVASVATSVPGVLFGLLIGAWVDRVDRKRLMIRADLLRAVVIASIPLLTLANSVPIWWIYAVGFVTTTLAICFSFAQVTAIARLVTHDDLVTANGRMQASFAMVGVIGPLLAGFLVALIPTSTLLFFDAGSFLISASLLSRITTSFNVTTSREPTTLRRDIAEGWRYVLHHPMLRAIAAIAALVNFVVVTIGAQTILFVKEWLQASDAQLGLFYAAESLGVISFSLAAGTLRKYLPFSMVALGAIILHGLLTLTLAITRLVWLAIPLMALMAGLIMIFNITVISLRQAVVPNILLGRVTSVLNVLAGSVTPLGTLIGGLAIDELHNVAFVYGVIGGLLVLIGLSFIFTPLGHAERYVPQAEATR